MIRSDCGLCACRQHVAAQGAADNSKQPVQHGQASMQALLQHLHAYYLQFKPAVDKALADGLSPIEKALKVGPA